jgi:Lon protease-like protein
MSDNNSPAPEFGGRARLFPLPNLVFFPHVMQPLHIFEPRYRQMTTDALAGDRLIALVMLQPDWEKDYQAKPAICSVACLGRVVADQRLEDGRFNLLLRGLSRIRILREIQDDKLYRRAEVEQLSDVEVVRKRQKTFRRALLGALAAWFPNHEGIYVQLKKVLQSSLPLGALADILTFAVPLGAEVKQQQLEELDVERRLECLLSHVPGAQAKKEMHYKFPPEFSSN